MIYVGSDVVIDECMSAWRGRDNFECLFVLPHNYLLYGGSGSKSLKLYTSVACLVR